MILRAMQTIYNSDIIHQPRASFATITSEIQNAPSISLEEISHTIGHQFAHSLSLLPDARFCYLTKHHKDGLLRIGWALNGRSLALMSGRAGSGRSTMLLRLAQELESTGEYETRIIRAPLRRTASAFSCAIAAAIGIAPERTTYDHIRQVAAHAVDVYASGKRLVLLIDEADRLTKRMCGILHSLAVVTVGHDLAIGMVLAGGLRMEKRLREYPALRSRVGATLKLEPLTIEEMRKMIEFRCAIAGVAAPSPSMINLRQLHRFTDGNPARIVKAHLVRDVSRKLGN